MLDMGFWTCAVRACAAIGALALVACSDEAGGDADDTGGVQLPGPMAGVGGPGGQPAGHAPNPADPAGPQAPTGGDDGSSQDTATPGGDGDSTDVDTGDTPATTPGDPTVWTQMGYDARNWYLNPHETRLSVDNAATLTQKWSFTVGGYPAGTPVVAEGKVFVLATGGLYAIDLETGEEAWGTASIRGTASIAYADGSIYAHTEGADLYRLAAADGTVEWGPVQSDAQTGCDGTSSPILGGGKVIVGHSCGAREVGFGSAEGARGGVEAHNMSDGSKAWTYWTAELDETGAMVWSSVGIDVDAGVVYATTGNNYLAQGPNSDSIHAIDLESGEGLWAHQVRTGDVWSRPAAQDGPDSDFGANPIVADGLVAAGDKGSAFWALDPATGNTVWSREQLTPEFDPAHGGILNNGAYDGETFYAVSNDVSSNSAVLFAMNAADGTDKFAPKTFSGAYSWGMPTLANGVLAVPVDDVLHILDASDGTELTSFNTGGTIAAGGAAIVDGHVIVPSGLSYPFDPNVKSNNQVICFALP